MYEKSNAEAKGEGFADSIAVMRIAPRLILLRTSAAEPRSSTSRTHSRYVSSRIGNDEYREATAIRSDARLRCCQSGARTPGRLFGRRSALPAASRNLAAK